MPETEADLYNKIDNFVNGIVLSIKKPKTKKRKRASEAEITPTSGASEIGGSQTIGKPNKRDPRKTHGSCEYFHDTDLVKGHCTKYDEDLLIHDSAMRDGVMCPDYKDRYGKPCDHRCFTVEELRKKANEDYPPEGDMADSLNLTDVQSYVDEILPQIDKIEWKFPADKPMFPAAQIGDMTVVLVDGDYVKTHHCMDFVEGGNDKVYDFVPKGSVWVDARLGASDGKAVALHELAERKLMADGVPYELAHQIANSYEYEYRIQCRAGNLNLG